VHIVVQRSYLQVLGNHDTVFTTEDPIMAQLIGNLDKRDDNLKGSLKTTHLGRLTPVGNIPVTKFPWNRRIVIKRMYADGKKSTLQRRPASLDMIDTIQELKNNEWGHALLTDAYAFMAEKQKVKGKPSFIIPMLQFVRIGKLMSGKPVRVMIIEEYIDPVEEGEFRKYLDNRSPIPFEFEDPEDIHRANFLCFIQHVMWERTQGYAFIGDFQGKYKFCPLFLQLFTFCRG
jgi:hypothetical protein